MTISPEELRFIAEFQPRLRKARLDLGWSHEVMAGQLGVSENAYKKYEGRKKSAFPLYLLPELIRITGRPAHYWLGISSDPRQWRARFRVVDKQPER